MVVLTTDCSPPLVPNRNAIKHLFYNAISSQRLTPGAIYFALFNHLEEPVAVAPVAGALCPEPSDTMVPPDALCAGDLVVKTQSPKRDRHAFGQCQQIKVDNLS